MNRRFVYGMRTLGKGQAGAKKFCPLMNMPPPHAALCTNQMTATEIVLACLIETLE